ncbi:MAG: hypothetical protein UW84_C0021G0008 [Candidatus Collierbacteria bacterium GW2011_GWA2_44_99]|uniref:Uncharacterized protein n=1 Tax=Candidatus Collierbacteria bacterium GW2011_GWA2_44_99 TaxID=1618380 RepID=A0A0G1NNP8_9BACT|nr:MAG: hypothetical protein UW84_C0021G0008 [Candidatus Collierbacteria bacterium GW2011_GWA2_44_99]
MTGKDGGHKNDESEGDGKKSQGVSQTTVEIGKQIQDKDRANGKKTSESKTQGSGKLGEGRAKKLSYQRQTGVDKKPTAEEEEEADEQNTNKTFGPEKFLGDGVVETD